MRNSSPAPTRISTPHPRERITGSGKKNSGFTLIELSVVIVIIGLVTGSLFWGMGVMRESELRSLVSDVDRFNKAMVMFSEKYNQLPGDMYNAEDLWGTDAGCPGTSWNTLAKKATCNGDGNRRISTRNYDDDEYENFRESFRAWQQLSNAGFLSESFTGAEGPSGSGADTRPGVNAPRSKLGEVSYLIHFMRCFTCNEYFSATYGHVIQIGVPGAAPDDYPSKPFLRADEAESIDRKIDDARPGYGKLLAPATQANCVTDDERETAQYNSGNNLANACSLIFITGL